VWDRRQGSFQKKIRRLHEVESERDEEEGRRRLVSVAVQPHVGCHVEGGERPRAPVCGPAQRESRGAFWQRSSLEHPR